MEDLIAWFKAALDEEERVAQAALWDGSERWEVLAGQDQPFHRPWQVIDDRDYGVAQLGIGGAADPEMLGRHIAYWDPPRVLVGVAVQRRRLTRHAPVDDSLHYVYCKHCSVPSVGAYEPWPCPDLLDDIQPYADREGFRAEWRLTP